MRKHRKLVLQSNTIRSLTTQQMKHAVAGAVSGYSCHENICPWPPPVR